MEWTYAARMATMGPDDVVALLKLTERADVISFAGGLPDPETYLLEEVQAAAAEVLATAGRAALGYNPTAGLTPLRDWVAGWMTQRGRPTSTDEVVITTGGIAALDLVCKVLLDPGDVVVAGQPTFLAALGVFRSYQACVVGVPLDDDGLRTDALEACLRDLRRRGRRPRFIYTVPTFQNPTGLTLSRSRRTRLVALAAEYGVPLVEDDPYRELRYEGEPLPLLAALDPAPVIHLNTFSKIFTPGVRLGWIVAPPGMGTALLRVKQTQDQCASTLGQHLTLAFASKGLIDRQVRAAVDHYRRKRDRTLAALRAHMPETVGWTRPMGGFYTWIRLPEGVHARPLMARAVEEAAVAFVPGPAFFADGAGADQLRLCFSYVPEDRIEPGVQRLARTIASMTAETTMPPAA